MKARWGQLSSTICHQTLTIKTVAVACYPSIFAVLFTRFRVFGNENTASFSQASMLIAINITQQLQTLVKSKRIRFQSKRIYYNKKMVYSFCLEQHILLLCL